MATTLKRKHTQLNYHRRDEPVSNSPSVLERGNVTELSKLQVEDADQVGNGTFHSKIRKRFPIKLVPTLASITEAEESPRKKVKVTASRPWKTFPKCFKKRSTIICQGSPLGVRYVAVKERKAKLDKVEHLTTFASSCVVSLLDLYFLDDTVYMIEEYMEVSLRNIASLPKKLGPRGIGLVCKAISLGLEFIHADLGLAHGAVHCGNVLVNIAGQVKIGNMGDSLLEHLPLTEENKRKDIRAIGLIMVELMEQITSALNPNSLKLNEPKKWIESPDILSFLADTDTHTLEELSAHKFLPSKLESADLPDFVVVAQTNAFIPIEFIAGD